jgi:hypothetical protein
VPIVKKTAMLIYPDHGGTVEQFIEAHRRYQTALSVGHQKFGSYA